ncbi:hypothetical protein [Chondromyces crocatus]|uniref:Secreted protein n=1 Tax=Chondromyces crocatus TaxID=52 RepID=A0A0K1E8P3_CHOCO|nr:hypothetical protein [Chondromyces crocatus]AKT37219.1 uncharacterized protein CMC5_013500 [Chondromyces crocatus]
MRKLWVCTLSLGALLLGASGCSKKTDQATSPVQPPTGSIVNGSEPCQSDADCVPASCCHPTACVAKASAPECGDIMCTQECRKGTLDCGGACLCVDGKCAARLNDLN